MNFVTAPPVAWIVLIRGALSSGAVNSSWIWNLLTSVLTVTGHPPPTLMKGIRFTEPLIGLYFTFSHLLTSRKLYLVLCRPASRLKATAFYPHTSASTQLVHCASAQAGLRWSFGLSLPARSGEARAQEDQNMADQPKS